MFYSGSFNHYFFKLLSQKIQLEFQKYLGDTKWRPHISEGIICIVSVGCIPCERGLYFWQWRYLQFPYRIEWKGLDYLCEGCIVALINQQSGNRERVQNDQAKQESQRTDNAGGDGSIRQSTYPDAWRWGFSCRASCLTSCSFMRSNSVASIVSPYEHYWTLNPEQGSHDPV